MGNIIAGEVNPSGKTADTWLKDLNSAPYINNIGHFAYTNTSDVSDAAKEAWERADGIVSFVDYVEGIYVGYRFYETAAEEGLINYDDTVLYPFGYGLSYTTFEQSMGELQVSDDSISVDVTVTNTGDTAGKDVVELYYNPPYYNGGIEKSSVNLAAFDKTGLLEPGQSETVTLTFDTEDMASYDTYGTGYYVLEQGDYEISLRTDSHTVVDTKTYSVPEMVVYDENKKPTGRTMKRNDWCLKDGEYHLTVLGVVGRPDGTFLITKRVMTKAWAPGWWEVSGGAAQAGEESCEAVLREVKEETGLDVRNAEGGYLFTYKRENPGEGDNYFVDVYRFVMDIDESDLHLQTEETDGYMFATVDEIKAFAAEGKFLHYDSIKKAFEM